MAAVGNSLNANRVCVTRGKDGNDDDVLVEHAGFSSSSMPSIIIQSEPGSDNVGAGDSFLAALIRSLLLEGEDPFRALERACALGGYVANCRGAVPDHSKAPTELKQLFAYQ